jgi:DNA-binding beta-propeller fold protein YncE
MRASARQLDTTEDRGLGTADQRIIPPLKEAPVRKRLTNGRLVLVLVVLTAAGVLVARELAGQSRNSVQAPYFEVDPMWPKPLPNHWVLGSTIGVSVDERDHVWIIHRGSATLGNNEKGLELNPPTGECCAGAPPVLEFDPEGNLVGHWGGPGEGYEWPASNHGITIDYKGNVWIGGNGDMDSQVLKFTKQGKFLLQVGKSAARKGPNNAQGNPTYVGGSNDQVSFGRVAKIFVDPAANEAYLADGYLNKRVAIIDADTGKLKRYWGAYGNKPDDTNLGPYKPEAPPAQQFRNPVHCADLSRDGFVYVCDRQNNRLQVFTKEGKFVKEAFYAKNSLSEGAVWDVAFSKDPQQTYIFLADGRNMKIRVLRRETLEELTSFGDGGRQPGQFYAVHSIATDSKGNLYTTETYEGKRVQKFSYKGLKAVSKKEQGTVWPR